MAEDRAWAQVLARIEGDLASGALALGDRLPPERALAAELGVGRSSVREAVRVLEVLGLVRTSTGSGPSSGAVIVAKADGGMSALMRLQVAGRAFDVAHVVRTRVVLEREVVRDLAERGADVTASRRHLASMDDASTPADFLALDAAFHYGLAELSGNSVVTAVMAGLRGSIERYVIDGALHVEDWTVMTTRLQREHHTLLDAIESGDSTSAQTCARDHIEGYYSDTNLVSLTKGH